MNTNFKTTMFGGFNKEDVISYIEKLSKESKEEILSLENENEGLRNSNFSISQENDELKDRITELEQVISNLNSNVDMLVVANQEIDRLNAKIDELNAQVAEMKGPAEEYRGLRDHIAEIEITAHRRTEEFRRNAIEELKSINNQQCTFIDNVKQSLAKANDEIIEKLKMALKMVEGCNYAELDQLIDNLKEVETKYK